MRTLRPAPGAPPRRGATQRPAPRLGRPRTPGVPITHRGAARPPEQGRCAGSHVHSAAAHRAGAAAPSRTGAAPSCPRTANAGASVLGHFLRPRPGAAGRAASHARWRMYLAPASEGLVAARYVRTALCPPLWPPHLRVPTNCQSSENPVYGVYTLNIPLYFASIFGISRGTAPKKNLPVRRTVHFSNRVLGQW